MLNFNLFLTTILVRNFIYANWKLFIYFFECTCLMPQFCKPNIITCTLCYIDSIINNKYICIYNKDIDFIILTFIFFAAFLYYLSYFHILLFCVIIFLPFFYEQISMHIKSYFYKSHHKTDTTIFLCIIAS